MSFNGSGGNERIRGLFSSWLEIWVYLCLIFLCTTAAVPGINESHYLPKAKHLWDASFAPGDLFLDSHDSHYLTSMLAGLTARWLPMAAVAWLGRVLSWLLLAWAWQRLRRSLRLPGWSGAAALLAWLLAIHYGNWAGEWVVGGVEAKTIAYPFVLLGLSHVVSGNWKWVWPCMGAAMMWHPLVGGWAGLSAGILWLSQPELLKRARQQLPWLAGGAALAMIGVAPALSGLSGPDVVDRVSAAQVHVYLRLPHHLAPQLFATERHVAAAITLVVFSCVTVLFLRTKPSLSPELAAGGMRLLGIGWLAVLFSLTGLAIDGLLTHSRPDIAARLLRFYWFRWGDVAVPLASSLLLWRSLLGTSPATTTATRTSAWAIACVLLLTAVGFVSQLQLGSQRIIPEADRLVVDSVGRNAIDTDRYTDWLAVCEWIRENTPQDSLWFTPKYQQTFKWHAQRAEVVCWKDVPQDNASVIEWYHRILACEPPRAADGSIKEWTTEQLLELSAKYGFDWVLLDRSYQSQPPALEMMYPVMEQGLYINNRSFAVMRIPDALRPPQP